MKTPSLAGLVRAGQKAIVGKSSPLASLITHVQPAPPKPSTLYFKPTSVSLYSLRNNTGQPHFGSHIAHPASRFEDVYYDTATTDGTLRKAGMSLRRRIGLWQLVRRVTEEQEIDGEKLEGNVKVSDTLVEGRKAVEDALMRELGWKGVRLGPSGTFGKELSLGLGEVGRWIIVREKFDVDGWSVVVDETDFGWKVGKVETVVESADLVLAQPSAGQRGTVDLLVGMTEGVESAKMDEVVRTHAWAFPGFGFAGESLDDGKLDAFLGIE